MSEHPLRVGLVGANAERSWAKVAHVPALRTLPEFTLNGWDLSLDHGYPVRAIVPGHYGMASTKWLTRIYAVREPFQGYWQTSDYGYWAYVDGKPVRRPLGETQLKSQIARPREYEVLAPGRP